MQIAIASGKGGTGKTTLATNLSFYLSQTNKNVTLLDCDVEEPNGHIFIKPEWTDEEKCFVPVPVVDKSKCTACGLCGKSCQFSAIAVVKDKVLTFTELCHGCGLCTAICPTDAITEGKREVGKVQIGKKDKLKFVHGSLRISEAMSPPLINAVKKYGTEEGITIIDAPPGTSCPVIAAVSGTDFVVLVTEPTPFGLNDLKLAVEMIRKMKIPFAVAINRSDIGDREVWNYCQEENIPIILEIPHDFELAKNYSKGNLVLEKMPHYEKYFKSFMQDVEKELRK